ncbi:hypothetical protein [Chlamydia crocodili]|uniref:hypothetical protein n=1 Tax=Chlamydia crocodili TaxID=2766982 RepID=UPI003D4AD1C0
MGTTVNPKPIQQENELPTPIPERRISKTSKVVEYTLIALAVLLASLGIIACSIGAALTPHLPMLVIIGGTLLSLISCFVLGVLLVRLSRKNFELENKIDHPGLKHLEEFTNDQDYLLQESANVKSSLNDLIDKYNLFVNEVGCFMDKHEENSTK